MFWIDLRGYHYRITSTKGLKDRWDWQGSKLHGKSWRIVLKHFNGRWSKSASMWDMISSRSSSGHARRHETPIKNAHKQPLQSARSGARNQMPTGTILSPWAETYFGRSFALRPHLSVWIPEGIDPHGNIFPPGISGIHKHEKAIHFSFLLHLRNSISRLKTSIA